MSNDNTHMSNDNTTYNQYTDFNDEYFNKLSKIAFNKIGLSSNEILNIIKDIDNYVPSLKTIFFENNITDFFSIFMKLIKTNNNIILG